MTTPPPGPPAASPLSDPENVMWVEEKPTEQLTTTEAYWRLRGMIPPVVVPLEE